MEVNAKSSPRAENQKRVCVMRKVNVLVCEQSHANQLQGDVY